MDVAFALMIEEMALRGAIDDPRPDKSDWIRIWATARAYMEELAGAQEWEWAIDVYSKRSTPT